MTNISHLYLQLWNDLSIYCIDCKLILQIYFVLAVNKLNVILSFLNTQFVPSLCVLTLSLRVYMEVFAYLPCCNCI